MAISRVADLTFTADAGTATNKLVSSGLFGSVLVGDRVYNTTRTTYSRISTVTDANTVWCLPAITGQVAGDSVTISSAIQVSGCYDTGTSTGIDATTITDTSKSWTTNILANRALRITSGDYEGAVAVIVSNTGTVATLDQWTMFNATDKIFEIVTPTGTPTYEVAYNWDDVVTALPSDAAWTSTTTKRNLRMTGGSGINLTGASTFFGDVSVAVALLPQSGIYSDTNGSCYMFGQFNSDIYGSNGGEILFDHTLNTY